jgi:hypothetical protein
MLLAFLTTTGFAADDPSSDQRIEALIQKLVSPNKAPEMRFGKTEGSGDYEQNARAMGAFSQLKKLGVGAFPLLFDHLDDQRYSFTADRGDADDNWSVGRACFDIVRCQLEPFCGFSVPRNETTDRGPPRPCYAAHINLRNPASAKVWWEARKSKSLRELQIEALQWAIAEEAKTPERYSDKERTKLQRVLAKLRVGNVPLAPTVPWVR